MTSSSQATHTRTSTSHMHDTHLSARHAALCQRHAPKSSRRPPSLPPPSLPPSPPPVSSPPPPSPSSPALPLKAPDAARMMMSTIRSAPHTAALNLRFCSQKCLRALAAVLWNDFAVSACLGLGLRLGFGLVRVRVTVRVRRSPPALASSSRDAAPCPCYPASG